MVLFGEGLCSFFIRNNTGPECHRPAPSCLRWSNGWFIIKQWFFTSLLPVEILVKTSYFQADIQGIENALRSAVDVMHTLGNSITARLPQVLIFYKSPLCGFLASYNIYWFTQCYRNKSCDVALSTEPCKRLLFLVWNHLPFFAVSPDECLGISALQSFRSRTHSDSTVQRLAVDTSINPRKGYIQTDIYGFGLSELLLF